MIAFLSKHKREREGVLSAVIVALAFVLAILLVRAARSETSVRMLIASVALILLGVVLVFAGLYWNYGTTANFNQKLTHLDATYVAVGTLSTVGTGNILATSETARALQAGQMALDFVIVVFGLSAIVVRYMGQRMPEDS